MEFVSTYARLELWDIVIMSQSLRSEGVTQSRAFCWVHWRQPKRKKKLAWKPIYEYLWNGYLCIDLSIQSTRWC